MNSVESFIKLAASEVKKDAIKGFGRIRPDSQRDDVQIFNNLQKAVLVCERMENISIKVELKRLIEDSIELFSLYRQIQEFHQPSASISPDSPASSMCPQLGIIQKLPTEATLSENVHDMAPEVSVLSVDSDEIFESKQTCINLKPLCRLGNLISQLIWKIWGYNGAVDKIVGEVASPAYQEPVSSSLQYYISQHRSPPPTLPLNHFFNEENCRSTDADCDNNEIQNWTIDELLAEGFPEKEYDSYIETSIPECKASPLTQSVQEDRNPSPNMVQARLLFPISSRLRLLATATAIGLSLCRAFLRWKNTTLLFVQFKAQYIIPISTEKFISRSKMQPKPLVVTTSQSSRRVCEIATGVNVSDSDCNSGSNCDSNSSHDNDHKLYHSSKSINRAGNRKPTASGHDLSVDDMNTVRNDPDKVLLKRLFRRSKNKRDTVEDCGDLGSIGASNDSSSVELNQENQGKWLSCLQPSDPTASIIAPNDITDSANNPTSTAMDCQPISPHRFEYGDVFEERGSQKRGRTRKNNRRLLAPSCITPLDISDSDSDSGSSSESNADSDENNKVDAGSSNRSLCFQVSRTNFAQSNPLSNAPRTSDKKNRSVSFDASCLPVPKIFDRRKRSQSISRLPTVPSLSTVDSITAISQDEVTSSHAEGEACFTVRATDTVTLLSNTEANDSSVDSVPRDNAFSFSFQKCAGLVNDRICNAVQLKAIELLSPISAFTKRSILDSPDGSDFRDCFGNIRERLNLISHIPARQDQYRAIGPVVRSNELAMWAIFAQYPMTCCEVNLETRASALAVHNYNCSKPLLSFACLRSLLSTFGVCPAICSESELLEHLKEMKIATSPPSSPFFSASPIKVCSFDTFVKILWLVASERMLMSAASPADAESSDLQARVRFAMLLHQMDISKGRDMLSERLLNSYNKTSESPISNECLSPISPVRKEFKEPILPLPAFDLSVLKEARTGTAARKMMVYDTTNKVRIKRKMIVKSSPQEKASRFAREITSGIATANSSEDLSDF